MRNTLQIALVISFVFAGSIAHTQTKVTVSDPRIELKDNIIHIQYDILNSSPAFQFEVRLVITDGDGNEIEARALEGDIGKEIPGGIDKHITWNLEADKIFLNTSIYFEVYATAESLRFSRRNLVLQSLAVPGLGLSKITEKPHWLKGVAGYGCIAGSVIFNLQARITYESIEDYSDFDDKKDLFDLSVSQDNLSDVLGWTALGIWVMDFIWTMKSTAYLKGGSMTGDRKGISVAGGLDPMTYTPTVNFRYRF